MRISNGFVLVSLMSSLAIGCGGTGSSSSSDSTYALDTGDVNSSEASVLSSALPVSITATASDDIASEISAKWAANFNPAGCATSTSSGANVTLTLSGCTGPYGLVAATGTLDLAITAGASGFSGTATATGMQVNKSVFDINASFTYVQSGGGNTLTVHGSGEGTGPRGNHITRSGSYTVTWTSSCFTLNGNWTTTVLGLTYKTTITDYGKCEGSCPQAGGDINWAGAVRTLDIKFDGSDLASVDYTGPNRNLDGTVNLECTPAA